MNELEQTEQAMTQSSPRTDGRPPFEDPAAPTDRRDDPGASGPACPAPGAADHQTGPAAAARPPSKLTATVKWHGGKWYLAARIIKLMPPHTHYVEPFAGGLAVLLAKDPEGISEVVNDLDGGLTNFWRVLQGEATFRRFHRMVEATPFSEPEWEAARDGLQGCPDADPVQRAFWFFIRCRQSLAGRMDSFAPLSRTRTRRGMNEQASAWQSAVEGLPAVHARLWRVAILNRPAVEVIRQQDGPGTLHYLDPPYVHETRTAKDVYGCEMSEADHRELLDVVRACKGKVMLSGYPSELYDKALKGWNRHSFDLANHAAGGKAKRRQIEVVWCNF
jgi:DNA adenine methylase